MSWQAYVADHLMCPGAMCGAGIYGLDGGEWAFEGCVRPDPSEIIRLINIIMGKEKEFNGIRLAGQSYLYVSHDVADGSIILRRIKAPSDKENYSCCAYLSRTCFIFGAVQENYKLGNCSKVVCRLRDYLKASGY